MTEWDYESARRDVIRGTTQAFVAVLAAQDRVVLAGKLVELSQQAQAAVTQRVEAGRDSPVDEFRASVALSMSRIEQQKAEKTLAAARHKLAAAWGGYRQGKFDYLYVLDTQRTLFQTQAQYIDSVEAYHETQADVQRLIGRPVDAESGDGHPSSPAWEPPSQGK